MQVHYRPVQVLYGGIWFQGLRSLIVPVLLRLHFHGDGYALEGTIPAGIWDYLRYYVLLAFIGWCSALYVVFYVSPLYIRDMIGAVSILGIIGLSE